MSPKQKKSLIATLKGLQFKLLKKANSLADLNQDLLFFTECTFEETYKSLATNTSGALNVLGVLTPHKRYWSKKKNQLQCPEVTAWAQSSGISVDYNLALRGAATSPTSHLRALLYIDDLYERCKNIQYKSQLIDEETHSHQLFLMFGFVVTSDQPQGIPILCMPIKLTISLAKKQISLHYTGEDIFINPLASLHLPPESIDYGGLQNETIADFYQSLSKNLPKHIHFSPRIALGFLDYLCHTLLANLTIEEAFPNTFQQNLVDHSIIQKLTQITPPTRISHAYSFDESSDPLQTELPLIYRSDRRQYQILKEIIKFRRNHVVQAPAGEIRTQFIANVIALTLAENRKILYITNKATALHNLQKQLEKRDLDRYVLSGSHLNKSQLISCIERSINSFLTELPRTAQTHQELNTCYTQLVEHQDFMSKVIHVPLNLTLFDVLWEREVISAKLGMADKEIKPIFIADIASLSRKNFEERTQLLQTLGQCYGRLGERSQEHIWQAFLFKQLKETDIIFLTRTLRTTLAWANDFSESILNLSQFLNVHLTTFSVTDYEYQQKELDKIIVNFDADLPFHLVSDCLILDGVGEKAQKILRNFQEKIDEYYDIFRWHNSMLQDVPKKTLEIILEQLKGFQKIMIERNVPLNSADQCEQLHQTLSPAIQQLEEANGYIQSFLRSQKIAPYDSNTQLDLLKEWVVSLLNIPQSYLHWQQEGLIKRGAISAIQELLDIQARLMSLEETLSTIFDLEKLPDIREIKKILTVLHTQKKENIFSKMPTMAKEHSALCARIKPATQENIIYRLEQLIQRYVLKEQFFEHSAWNIYLESITPQFDLPLQAILNLATWNEVFYTLTQKLSLKTAIPKIITPKDIAKIVDEFTPLHKYVHLAQESMTQIANTLAIQNENHIETFLNTGTTFLRNLEKVLPWIRKYFLSNESYQAFIEDCTLELRLRKLQNSIDMHVEAQKLLKERFQGTRTRTKEILQALHYVQSLDEREIFPFIRNQLKANFSLEFIQRTRDLLAEVCIKFQHIQKAEKLLQSIGKITWDDLTNVRLQESVQDFALMLPICLEEMLKETRRLDIWAEFFNQKRTANRLGLHDFLAYLKDEKIDADQLAEFYSYSVYHTIIDTAIPTFPPSMVTVDYLRRIFAEYYENLLQLNAQTIAVSREKTHALILDKERFERQLQIKLTNQSQVSFEQFLSEEARSIQTILPCFLMGASQATQYLSNLSFDLVVIDEISKMPIEDVLKVIATGKQLLILGDNRQSFSVSTCNIMKPAGSADSVLQKEDGLYEIAMNKFDHVFLQRTDHLDASWKNFINHYSYGGALVGLGLPSPYPKTSLANVIYVPEASYKDGVNLEEAQQVIASILSNIEAHPDKSLGVVTFTLAQRDLIKQLFEETVSNREDVQQYQEAWQLNEESFFIKFIEHIQGDERDIIIISTTFDFEQEPFSACTALLGHEGLQRINTLLTRAKLSLFIYTMIQAEMRVSQETDPPSIQLLKGYLQYSQGRQKSRHSFSDNAFYRRLKPLLAEQGFNLLPWQLMLERIEFIVVDQQTGEYLALILLDKFLPTHNFLFDTLSFEHALLEHPLWQKRVYFLDSFTWLNSFQMAFEQLIQFLENVKGTPYQAIPSPEQKIKEVDDNDEGNLNNFLEEIPTLGDPNWRFLETASFSSDETQSAENLLKAYLDVIEVDIGDVVQYRDMGRPDEVLTIQITNGKDNFEKGIINETRPLAQTLLGAIENSEVSLNIPGFPSRRLEIVKITKHSLPQSQTSA